MILKTGSKCPCGQQLPWHLFEFGPMEHTCSCGRKYRGEADQAKLLQERDEQWKNFQKNRS
jgi:hypothetical protein